MRRTSLAALPACCPVCRTSGRTPATLELRCTWRAIDDRVAEGLLACIDPACGSAFPIVDGIPIIRADAPSYIGQQFDAMLRRTDLAPELEQMLSETAASVGVSDAGRQHAAMYAWDGFGTAATSTAAGTASADHDSAVTASLERLLDAATTCGALGPDALCPEDTILDLGCGVARSSLDLAARSPARVLGIDANWSLLRVASGVLLDGVARFPHRRSGLVHERMDVTVDHPGRSRVDCWCADAHTVPLADGCARLAVALNVLDCLHDPPGFLVEVARVLAPGGTLLLSTPFDWTVPATPVESWIGGRAPLALGNGDPATVLTDLLTPDAPGPTIPGLRCRATVDDIDWRVRLHDRSTVHYRSFGVVVERVAMDDEHD